MKKIQLTLVAMLLLSGCSDGSPTEPEGRVVTTEVYSASRSGISVARNEKIETRERFAAVWNEVHSNQTPVPAMPQINFDSYDVLLAARGTTPDPCFSIEVGTAVLGASALAVEVVKIDPAANCPPCPAVTGAPVHMVRVRKPRVAAQFTTTTRTRNC